jgi:hypothetical protein
MDISKQIPAMCVFMLLPVMLLVFVVVDATVRLDKISTMTAQDTKAQDELTVAVVDASGGCLTSIYYLIGKHEKELQLGQAIENHSTQQGSGSTKATLVKIKGEGAMPQGR